MQHIERGRGKPLLLVHGPGGSWQSWSTVLEPLAAQRRVTAIDLPGHGASPADEAKRIAPLIDRMAEFAALDRLIGALLGTRDDKLDASKNPWFSA